MHHHTMYYSCIVLCTRKQLQLNNNIYIKSILEYVFNTNGYPDLPESNAWNEMIALLLSYF